MCGIFGIVQSTQERNDALRILAQHSLQRGRDSSGLAFINRQGYQVRRGDYKITQLLDENYKDHSSFVMGHSRLITNGLSDNQPIVKGGMVLIHNGIIVNDGQVWKAINQKREFTIDSEAILGVALQHISEGGSIEDIPFRVFELCRGTISAALALPLQGKLLLFSNNGSLYLGDISGASYFSSERYPLEKIGCLNIRQILNQVQVLDIPLADKINVTDEIRRKRDLIPTFKNHIAEEKMLKYEVHELKRCTKCILPETMPYISFDQEGVCNYCRSYKLRNNPKPKEDLVRLLEPYRRLNGADCIVPFSGGRDSCWGLHLIVKELGMKPITYTYDWGMVTDLGRRNVSRMCSELGVENIIIADDLEKKRRNILMNLKAWLRRPNLGMISILTAGDKHFFRHVETVKKQTGISLNLWGVNPLEVTHFKAGFLGVPPDFEEKRVYKSGLSKQLRYQWLRMNEMVKNPGYLNSSIWDTLSGEYYRSFTKKNDYYHIFDYWRWDEKICNETLRLYEWELAPDTSTTWRIGDGTAAFYNYLYYTIAGFSEHDTFRSNQIREGQLTRDEALTLTREENRPRYQNIRWYLDVIGLEFSEVIPHINSIPPMQPV